VHGPEPGGGFARLRGLRVVADPAALDGARWQGDSVTILRLAPDDAFALGAEGADLDDEYAIVEPEVGFVGAWLPLTEILPHVEWPLPPERPALAQGSIVGVPAKLWLAREGDALLMTAAAHADDLAVRLR
jgi:hypothetical protein